MKPFTPESRKALIENFRLLADKLEAGMVVEEAKNNWHVVDTGIETKWISPLDPTIEEDWCDFQTRPKSVNYTLDITFQPHTFETKPKKKKRKVKKNG